MAQGCQAQPLSAQGCQAQPPDILSGKSERENDFGTGVLANLLEPETPDQFEAELHGGVFGLPPAEGNSCLNQTVVLVQIRQQKLLILQIDTVPLMNWILGI